MRNANWNFTFLTSRIGLLKFHCVHSTCWRLPVYRGSHLKANEVWIASKEVTKKYHVFIVTHWVIGQSMTLINNIFRLLARFSELISRHAPMPSIACTWAVATSPSTSYKITLGTLLASATFELNFVVCLHAPVARAEARRCEPSIEVASTQSILNYGPQASCLQLQAPQVL